MTLFFQFIQNINPEYLRRKAKAFAKANKEYRSLISKNGTNWVIAAVPIK
jgi:leucyl aminopeptidase (aminopeptidase T)